MTAIEKQKFPRLAALEVAKEILATLQPWCERLVIAGSLRRGKQAVGDIEILYIPKFATVADGLFGNTAQVNIVNERLDTMIGSGTIAKRLNIRGHCTWGESNKLARHVESRIPVDFFEANLSNWFNYLVCRTGGSASNIRIAQAAHSKGLKWHPYGSGFTDRDGNDVLVNSEQDVFRLAGLPYLEPNQRE